MIHWKGIPYAAAKSVFGPNEWKSYFRTIRRSNLTALGQEYLRSLLRHACEQIPHYQALGLDGRQLSEFPVITKADLRQNPQQFQRKDRAHRAGSLIRTSGSTGDVLELIRDQQAAEWMKAADMWYYSTLLETSPLSYICASKVFIWRHSDDSSNVQSLKSRLARHGAPILWLSPYAALSEKVLIEYARRIARVRPSYIWSFAGVLYELARVALARGIRLPKPIFIISSGETLHTYMRPIIEQAFGCRVYDYYGSAEAGRVAGECRAGNLHLFEFCCHSEVVDASGRAVLAGQEGRLILTPLHNYVMPLIRYDSADMAEMGPDECPCGYPLPTLARISGRTAEFFVSSEGSLVSPGQFSQLIRTCPWVMGFQILQRDVDQLTVYYSLVSDGALNQADVEKVNAGISALLGEPCRIAWQQVDEIPRTPNGKRPYARSLVWEQRQPVSVWERT